MHIKNLIDSVLSNITLMKILTMIGVLETRNFDTTNRYRYKLKKSELYILERFH